MRPTSISIVGTGYVGLVSGACLADRGHRVVCIDVDATKVEAINQGRSPIHEAGLDNLLARHSGKGLRATTDLAAAVMDSQITLIAVGTPARDGQIDLTQVEQAAGQVGQVLRNKADYHLLVVKSTVVPGTTDGVVRRAVERASGKRAGVDFGLGMNPEFLTEGQAVADFMNPDRLVIGGIDERSRQMLAGIYSSFLEAPRQMTNNATAEMIKYASNALLATMISYSNELAGLCRTLDEVDIVDVMHGVHQSAYLTTRRPGQQPVRAGITSFLEAGCGFGGSCLPKDVTALAAHGRQLGRPMPMLQSVLDINAAQPDQMMALVQPHFASLQGVRVTVLGLAFKPDTDDTRCSPAFALLRRLSAAGAQVSAWDPVVRQVNDDAMAGVRLADSLEQAVAGAQVVMLVTRWPQFQALASLIGERADPPLVVDGRRVLERRAFAHYEGIGLRQGNGVRS